MEPVRSFQTLLFLVFFVVTSEATSLHQNVGSIIPFFKTVIILVKMKTTKNTTSRKINYVTFWKIQHRVEKTINPLRISDF